MENPEIGYRQMNLNRSACVYALMITCAFVQAVQAADSNDHGMSAGGFIFKPAITIAQEYSDNIYTEESGEDGDFTTHIKPELTIKKTDIGQNRLQVNLGGEQVLYADDSDNDYLNYHAGLQTRYVFNPRTSWEVAAEYRHSNSKRGDNDADPAAVAAEPLENDRMSLRTSVVQKIGAFTLTPRLSYIHLDFEDGRRINGTVIEQDTRDRDEYMAGTRLSYPINKWAEIFADGEFGAFDYDESTIQNRDSDGGSYLVGMRYRPSKALLIEGAAGYMDRNYDDPTFDSVGTWDATARLDYTYIPDGMIKLRANRSIVEVTDATVGGAVRSSMTASISYPAFEDTTLSLDLRYNNTVYEGGLGSSDGSEDREDHYYSVGLSTEYAVSEFAKMLANYHFGRNDSNQDTSEYSENVFMVGLKIGF